MTQLYKVSIAERVNGNSENYPKHYQTSGNPSSIMYYSITSKASSEFLKTIYEDFKKKRCSR